MGSNDHVLEIPLRHLIALACCLALPVWAADAPSKAPAKAAAKPVAKAPAKPAAKPVTTVAANDSRTRLHSQAAQVASGIRAAEAALTPEELNIAQAVHVGRLPCELGAFVQLTADEKNPGYFDLKTQGVHYRMVPVPTSTGAVRLEDAKAGAVWLQLANKSMLMNQKQGRRMADDCKSPEQTLVAEALLKAPAPSLLEPLPAARTPAPVPETTAVAVREPTLPVATPLPAVETLSGEK